MKCWKRRVRGYNRSLWTYSGSFNSTYPLDHVDPIRDWPSTCLGSTGPSCVPRLHSCDDLPQVRVLGSSCHFHILMKHTLQDMGSGIPNGLQNGQMVELSNAGDSLWGELWLKGNRQWEETRQTYSLLFLFPVAFPRHGYYKYTLQDICCPAISWVPKPLILLLLFPLSPSNYWRTVPVAMLTCTPGQILPSCDQAPNTWLLLHACLSVSVCFYLGEVFSDDCGPSLACGSQWISTPSNWLQPHLFMNPRLRGGYPCQVALFWGTLLQS